MTMINRTCLAFVATMALVSLATAAFRGGDDVDVASPFTCSISAFDDYSCKKTRDDDGEGCVWCTFQTHSFCVSVDQSGIIGQAVPDITCEGDKEREEESKESEDDLAPLDVFDCLPAGDKDSCGGGYYDGCTWCAGVGLCLSTYAASMVEGYSWFTCEDSSEDNKKYFEQAVPDVTYEGEEEQEEESEDFEDDLAPLDVFDCLPFANKDSCGGGYYNGCTWCAGVGLCLSTYAASMVEGYSWFTCEDSFDPSCVVAGISSDDTESVCKGTVDQDGDSCVWCDAGGKSGLCLNPDQADAVSQHANCGSSTLIDTELTES